MRRQVARGVPKPAVSRKSLTHGVFRSVSVWSGRDAAHWVLRNSYVGAYWLAAVMLLVLSPTAPCAVAADEARATAGAQRIVDDLRTRLGLAAAVTVALVEQEARGMSVRASQQVAGTFDLRIDRAFAASLPPAQLEAALAHELGHVWISTHHPFLQTEELANRIAMRVVSRERLVDVYRAVWGAEALHGSLQTFLGVQAATAQQ